MVVFLLILGLMAFLSSDLGKGLMVVVAKGILGLISLCFSSFLVIFVIVFVINLMLNK